MSRAPGREEGHELGDVGWLAQPFSMMPFIISAPRDLVRLLPSSVSINAGQIALI